MPKLVDFLQSEAEIDIEIYGEDYTFEKRRFFSSKESGSRGRLFISGKPSLCMQHLGYILGLTLQKDTKQLTAIINESNTEISDWELASSKAVKLHVSFWSALGDIFRRSNTLIIERVGSNHQAENKWFVKKESGERMKITVRGKPGFAQIVINRLSENSLEIQEILKPVLIGKVKKFIRRKF